MRLLIAGDVHGNTAHMLDLLRTAGEHGCAHVLQLGDFGAWEHTADGRGFLAETSLRAGEADVDVVWLDGNHDDRAAVMAAHGERRDDAGFVTQAPHVLYAPRGHRWEWDGVRFMALGGAYSVDKGWRVEQEHAMTLASERRAARTGRTPRDFTGWLWFPGEELTDDDVTAAIGGGADSIDVLLTHDKPRRSVPDWNRKDLPRCWPNQDRAQAVADVLRPSSWYHGHLHYRYDDVIQLGDGNPTPCLVHGLGADPWSAEHAAYDPRDSWVVVDTADLGS